EHTDRVGGTTAISGGMVWVPANDKMDAVGIDDSLDNAAAYLAQLVPGSANDVRMQTFLREGPETIRYLETNTSLKLQPVRRYPDYYPALAGATPGARVLEPVPFDGRELGADFALLQIGRASCRERVESSVGAGRVKRTEIKMTMEVLV